MEKQKNIPKLRFPEYKGLWEKKTLREVILSVESGVSVNSIDEPVCSLSDKGVLKTSCISSGKFNPEENKIIVSEEIQRAKLNPEKDTIIVSRMNTPQLVGESGYVETDFSNLFIPDRLWLVRVKKEYYHTKLVSIILSSERTKALLSNFATGTSGSMKNISQPNFLKIALTLPTLPEQQKIASFFTAIDQKISQLKQKKTLLEQYKKGGIQKIFSQEIRFKDDKGQRFPKWEKKKLGDLLIESSEKTTISSQHRILSSTAKGIFNQDEYFNRDIASKDNSGYKILKLNQLVFSPQNLWLGNINVNTEFEIGIVSPSYKIFSFNSEYTTAQYCKHYLTIPEMMFEYEQASEQGASVVRRNLSMDIFLEIRINLPTLPEQTKIADFLSVIDDKINQTQTLIEKAELWKKGLMQQMFV